MGKVRRQRQKYHAASSSKEKNTSQDDLNTSKSDILVTDNIFAGLDISLDNLKTNLNYDTRSVASNKSSKTESQSKQNVPKKDKLKMRRVMLMKRIDLINQMKKEEAIRKKRSNNVIMGDTNALRDALPSIDHLTKPKVDKDVKVKEKRKKKPIAKASIRKMKMVDDFKLFKTLLKSKKFKSDPVNVVKEHVSKMIESGLL